jgi:uncharacterized membrane protein
VSISVQSASASGLGVMVNYGPVPCVAANPSVSISPANPSAQAGSNVGYTVTVINNDSSGCSAGTFQMSSSLPVGWTTSFGSSALVINPGQSLATSMTKSVPAGTPVGTYSVNATASQNTFSGSSSASVTVVQPPSVTVSVAQAS